MGTGKVLLLVGTVDKRLSLDNEIEAECDISNLSQMRPANKKCLQEHQYLNTRKTVKSVITEISTTRLKR